MLFYLMTFIMTMIGLSGCSHLNGVRIPGSKQDKSAEKIYKVGIVQYVDNASSNQITSNIEARLDEKSDELGVVFNYADYTFNGQADSSTLDQIASELLADEVDLIIPVSTPCAQAIQTATVDKKVPVVFSAVSDPVGAGLVASLYAPGANVTGVSDALNTEAVLNLMFSADPEIKKVGLLYDDKQEASASAVTSARQILDARAVSYIEQTAGSMEEVSKAADALIEEKVEAVFTPTDNTIMTAQLNIYQKFIKAGIPHYAGADSFALNGAFCGFGVNYQEVGKETADMAVDILVNGADPAAIPVKTLSSGIATVNVETAEALGIDYSTFAGLCEEVVETVTKQEFDD